MTLHTQHKLSENKNGAHVYVGPDFVNDSANPLVVGEEVDIITIPHTAVVIAPANSLELPTQLTIRDPGRTDSHRR